MGEFMPKFYTEKQPEKGVWERVAEEALSKLKENPDIAPDLIAKAEELINDPEYKFKIKKIWDEATINEAVDEDPEKQDHLWAKGLAERLKDELSIQEKI